jgi:hypothetical protein
MTNKQNKPLPDWAQDMAQVPFNPMADRAAFNFNEPLPPDNVATLVPKARSLHATLCEARAQSQALLSRLENGACVPSEDREVVRELYVCTRKQLKALASALEPADLE